MPDRFILLVEDNEDDEVLTLRALRKNHIANEVVVARDGVEALEFLFGTGAHAGRDTTQQPQVVLLDLNLPDMTGQDVAGRIRGEAGPNCATRLIAYTAADVDVAALQAAFDGCIEKPIDPRRLVTLLFATAPLNQQG